MAKEKPWFKVLNTFYNHEKTLEAGNTACGIWIRMMSCTASSRNDGFVSEVHVNQIVPPDERWAFQRLIHVGLVEERTGGYYLKDYLKYNTSRADIEKEEERDRENGKKSGVVRDIQKQVATGEAHPFAKQHHDLFKKYPAWNTANQLKKWMAICAERVGTAELVRELGIAIDLFVEEQKNIARRKGCSWKEHTDFIMSPEHFLVNSDGSEHWKLVIAANDTPIHSPEERQQQIKNKPLTREKLPWDVEASLDPDLQEKRRLKWPPERQRQWVDEHLKDKDGDFRQRWLQAHELTDLFVAVAS